MFEIINKPENTDWKKCPEKMADLKPISFKRVADSFPNVFLFAVKYKKSEVTGKQHGHSEIFAGDNQDENKKLITIYTNNAQNSDYLTCTITK